MASNYVSIVVKASDDATPDLDALKARFDELAAKTANATIDVNDVDAVAKITDMNAKLAALGARVANPKLSMSGALRVEAQLAALDAQLDKTNGKSVDIKARADGFAGALASVTGLDNGLKGAMDSGSKFQLAMAGLNIATGIAEPLIAGVTVAAGGLAAGLVTAGAGLGVFALVAKSAYSQVSAAVTAYGLAQSTTGKASATAMAQYKADMASLTPAQQDFAKAINGVNTEWGNFVAANTSGVTQILKQGMGLLPGILQQAQPLLTVVEGALSQIIGDLSKDMKSEGFITFMAGLQAYGAQDIEDIATRWATSCPG